jgi:hypothetical protein
MSALCGPLQLVHEMAWLGHRLPKYVLRRKRVDRGDDCVPNYPLSVTVTSLQVSLNEDTG